jgi:hypothetical protein
MYTPLPSCLAGKSVQSHYVACTLTRAHALFSCAPARGQGLCSCLYRATFGCDRVWKRWRHLGPQGEHAVAAAGQSSFQVQPQSSLHLVSQRGRLGQPAVRTSARASSHAGTQECTRACTYSHTHTHMCERACMRKGQARTVACFKRIISGEYHDARYQCRTAPTTQHDWCHV